MNTLDIIIIAVVVLCGINGLIRGFIKTLFGLTSLLLALVMTWVFTPTVSQFIIDETAFDETISEQTVELLDIEEMVSVDLDTSDALALIDDLPLPENIQETLVENYTETVIDGFDFSGVGDYIGGVISVMAVKALTFVLLFILITIVLNTLVTLLDLIARLPVLKQANRIGGLGLGLIIGIVSVWIGILCLSFVISIQSTENISNLIESSILAQLFYYNNPLQEFVMNIQSSLQ